MGNADLFRFWRRPLQTGVALAFAAVPALNLFGVNQLSGNFLSFNFAGLPLADPLAVLQVALGTFSGTQAMLVGAGMTLLPALLLGPVFCAWICPFGLLSELVHHGRHGRRGRRRSEAMREGPARRPISARPFAGRALLALAGLLAVLLIAPVPVLNQLSMPGWYSRALQQAMLYKEPIWGIALILSILAGEWMLGRRVWCRYFCPQSVLISLAGMLLPARLRVRFSPGACSCPASDRACLGACSLALNPRASVTAQRLQCSNCGDCVDACRTRGGALSLGFGADSGASAAGGASVIEPECCR